MAEPQTQNGLVMPVVYDGTIPWDQWIFLYEVAANMNGWNSDPVKMANMLIFSLRGHALSLCLTLDEATRKDYEALKAKLNEVLCPEDTLDMLIAQLEQRKRKPEETLIDLKVDIHKLVCKVYPGMEASVLEKHARVAFLKSISGTSYGEKTIDAQPKTLEEALQKAQFYEQREEQARNRKSDPARRYLAKATTLDRLFGPAWLAYGHSFAVENEHDQAMAAYFKASQLMKGCHLPLLYIGLECGLTNNVRLAEKFFQQAQNIAPDDPFVMHEMGVIAFQNLDYKAAEKHFKDALNRIRCNQDSAMVEKWEPLLNNLGHTCRKLKKYEESLEYHHQALVLSPQNASTYSAIGYTKALMGLTEESVDWFHRALGLKRDDTFSTTMLNYAIEQLADESPPYPNAPSFIPDFSLSSPKVAQEDIFIDTSDADVTGNNESQNVQQDSMSLINSDVNMSMSFEIVMPDAEEDKT